VALKNIVWFAVIISFGSVPALSQDVDKSKPHGRACVAIANVANGDEEPLRAARTAGKNQKLVAHLDATAPCDVLVAPFLKSGELAAGWLPAYVELSATREGLVPKAPVTWMWEKDQGPLAIYVLFQARGGAGAGEIRELVTAMGKAKDPAVLKLQASKLRELIGRSNFDRQAALRVPKPNSEVAGTMRMVVGFEWRDFARAVNFSSEKSGVLIFPANDSR
jgi:hypothetical protein